MECPPNSRISPEALTHRLGVAGAALVVALGLFQWLARTSPSMSPSRRTAFAILCFVGGALALSHSQTVIAVKWAFLIVMDVTSASTFSASAPIWVGALWSPTLAIVVRLVSPWVHFEPLSASIASACRRRSESALNWPV